MQRSQYDWNLHGDTENACQASPDKCFWPRGKMLGGSSSMNLMLYIHGLDRDYNSWEAAGNPGWGYENVLKYLKKSEGNQNAEFVQEENGRYHNATGPLKVSLYGDNRYDEVFYEAGTEQGVHLLKDYNAGKPHVGNFIVQGTVDGGVRQSAAVAFLTPAMNRTNLKVIRNAFATKVLFNANKEAYGVEFLLNGRKLIARSSKEVILSAGALLSPAVLMQSGIGPKPQLDALKIPNVANLNVGKRLWDHVAIALWFSFDPHSGELAELPIDLTQYMLTRSGRFAGIGTFHLLGFLSSQNQTDYPDLEVYHLYMQQSSFDLGVTMSCFNYKPEFAQTLYDINERRDIAGVLVSLLQPKSQGTVELSSADPLSKPNIKANFFNEKEDYDTGIRGIKQQMNLLKTKTYKERGAKFIRMPLKECDAFTYLSDEYWVCYIKYFGFSIYHPAGTCKMGPKTDPEAVVDPRLRVHKVKKIRTADASM